MVYISLGSTLGSTLIWVVVSNIFLCSPLLGEMIQFDEHIFQMGWFNHQLVMKLQRVWGGAVAMIVMESTGMNLPSAQACGACLSHWRRRGHYGDNSGSQESL